MAFDKTVNFGVDFSKPIFQDDELEQTNKYLETTPYPYISANMVLYENAEYLAKCFELRDNCRYDTLLSGNFIFGDLIEAIVVKHNCFCENLTISTLSYSEENIQSLRNLINGGFIGKLNIIVSDYFFSHERNNLIRKAYKMLDVNNCFNLVVAGVHTKIVLIESKGGKKIVMHGSANLRSSRNIEQCCIEENKELYDGYWGVFEKIVEKYKIDGKAARGGKLWDLISE